MSGLRKVTLEVTVFDSITAKDVECVLRVGAGESCDEMFTIHSTRILKDEEVPFEELGVK